MSKYLLKDHDEYGHVIGHVHVECVDDDAVIRCCLTRRKTLPKFGIWQEVWHQERLIAEISCEGLREPAGGRAT